MKKEGEKNGSFAWTENIDSQDPGYSEYRRINAASLVLSRTLRGSKTSLS